MEVVKFKYKETEIEFNPASSDNVMVNATQMAKAFDRRIDKFLKNPEVQAYIEAYENDINLNTKFPPTGGNLTLDKGSILISSHGRNGTFMHINLAIRFAMWLSPEFSHWVISTFVKVIRGEVGEYKEAYLRQIRIERAYEQKKRELLENTPGMSEYLELEAELKAAKYSRVKLSRENMNQMKLNFGEL